MLTESATLRIQAVAAPIDEVARQLLEALGNLEPGS
jgi:hypothetical protein